MAGKGALFRRGAPPHTLKLLAAALLLVSCVAWLNGPSMPASNPEAQGWGDRAAATQAAQAAVTAPHVGRAGKAAFGASQAGPGSGAGRKGGMGGAALQDLPAALHAQAGPQHRPALQVSIAAGAAEPSVLKAPPPKRLRVLLRYTACGGLINQHYSHISAFALAAALGAELVLPPAVCRDSFGHYFSVLKDKNEVQWSPAPLGTLLDVDSIISRWASLGMVVHRTPALRPFPDLTQPESAFPRYPLGGLDPYLITSLPGVYLQNLPLGELMERARLAVLGHATAIRRHDPLASLPYIVLDLPCSFFALQTISALPVVTDVARSLAFSPALHAMADRIFEAATAHGRLTLNGVHLRIERDARDWATIVGGQQMLWRGYIGTMRQLGFNSTTRLYVASGILSYSASEEMALITDFLQRAGVCAEVHHKEQFIPQAELAALNSEQKALVDFLVLARVHRFAGFGGSTFSFYLREHRALQSMPRGTSGLVDSSPIGTDQLFSTAGTVV